MHYFKCVNPRQKIWLSQFNGWLQFQNVDNEVGIFQTQRDDVAQVIRGLGLSTVTEITAAEFVELEGKKKADLSVPPKWREEIAPGQRRSAMSTVTSAPPAARPAPTSTAPSEASAAAKDSPPPKLASVPAPPVPELKPRPKLRRKSKPPTAEE